MSHHQESAPAPDTWGSSDAALYIQSLKKRHASDNSVFELEVPKMVLPRGSFTAIVGSSGCGKSTLLDMIALISKPNSADRFELSVDARSSALNISSLWERKDEKILAAQRRNVGYILQTGGLLPFLNVGQNAMLSFQIQGRSADTARIRNLASSLGIGEQLGKAPHRLSGGQRQRAAILRALAHEPTMILADEPTAAVDKPRAEEIIEELTQLVRNEGLTLVMVTHDSHLVARRADQIFGFDVESRGSNHSYSTCRSLSAHEISALAHGIR